MTTRSGPRKAFKPLMTMFATSHSLRKKFLDLKQLRKKVEDLERMAAKAEAAKRIRPTK